MKMDEYNILIDRAAVQKDGVYSFGDYLYVVKNKRFIAFADWFGNCYACFGMFTTQIGKCERYDRRKKLTEYLNHEDSI